MQQGGAKRSELIMSEFVESMLTRSVATRRRLSPLKLASCHYNASDRALALKYFRGKYLIVVCATHSYIYARHMCLRIRTYILCNGYLSL